MKQRGKAGLNRRGIHSKYAGVAGVAGITRSHHYCCTFRGGGKWDDRFGKFMVWATDWRFGFLWSWSDLLAWCVLRWSWLVVILVWQVYMDGF